jgi:RNA recognition motif-containing protein
MENKLYVGNLSYSTSESDLQALFSKAGSVKSVSLITDRDTGRSKGFAFVEMETQAEAQKAISMLNGTELGERTLTVNMARPREERSGGGYGRRGSQRPGGRSRGRGSDRY